MSTVRWGRTELSGVVPAKVRWGRAQMDGAVAVILGTMAAQVVEPLTQVNLEVDLISTATPDTWTWTQLSGPAATITPSGNMASFQAPAHADGGDVVIQVVAAVGATNSLPSVVTVKVLPHLLWKAGASAWAAVRRVFL